MSTESNHSKPHPKRKKIDAARDAQFDVTAHTLGQVFSELGTLKLMFQEINNGTQKAVERIDRAQAQIINLGEEMIRTKKSL